MQNIQNFALRHSLKKTKAKKAIATHTVVLIIMMGMFAIIGFFLFYKWAEYTNIEASMATCTFKKIAYCTDWKANNYGTEPWTWSDKPPKGCEAEGIGITKPTKEQCGALVQ